jgi:soluble lytic murein transglycosylase-like protein
MGGTTTTTTTSHGSPGSRGGGGGGSGRADVPSAYRRLYAAAGRAYGVNWRLLAAIGKMESDHGRSTAAGVQSGLNFAHCCAGPMQICTVKSCGNAWAKYGVDADGDGIVSVYDPADAIFGAAAIVHDLQALLGPHPKLLLAAYNAGAGSVRRYRGVPPYPETVSYVQRGLKYMASLRH